MIDGIIEESVHGAGRENGRALYQCDRAAPAVAADEGYSLIKQIVALALLCLATHTLAAETDAEQELREVRERIAELQLSARRDADRRDALSGQLRTAEEKVRDARARLGDVRKRLAVSDAHLKELAADRARNEKALGREREALAAELRTAYMGGRQEQFKMLLSQENPAEFGRMLVYYAYFGRARAARIGEIREIVVALEQAAEEEEAERERLAALEAESREELSSVDAARDERSRALKAMNAQIKNRNDSIAKLKREAAALEKLIADLRQAMRDLPPTGGQAFEKVRGRLAWPVQGRIVARFGQARGGGLKWNGVMIEANRGTAVRALYDGRVAYADWLPGMGLLLIIDHGGYMSLYAHNEQLYKSAGDAVTGGEAIGTVGDSGGRSQPGLYLEIRRGAKAIDPVPWFRRSSP